MLYTTWEFSSLPGRGVGCSGCAAHRTDCDKKPLRARMASKPTDRMAPAHRRKVARLLDMLRIDEDIEKVCLRTGCFGEDGSFWFFKNPPDSS